jgi:hypothetical protein
MHVLVGTVLMQEVYFQEPASTQKLWISCYEPVNGSWSESSVIAKKNNRMLVMRLHRVLKFRFHLALFFG